LKYTERYVDLAITEEGLGMGQAGSCFVHREHIAFVIALLLPFGLFCLHIMDHEGM
jgi:hypothetical protein